MVWMFSATLPGHWWMDSSGTKAMKSDEAFSTLTSISRTEAGPPKPRLSTTDTSSLTTVSPEIKPLERSKAVSPVASTGVSLMPLYRSEDRTRQSL